NPVSSADSGGNLPANINRVGAMPLINGLVPSLPNQSMGPEGTLGFVAYSAADAIYVPLPFIGTIVYAKGAYSSWDCGVQMASLSTGQWVIVVGAANAFGL